MAKRLKKPKKIDIGLKGEYFEDDKAFAGIGQSGFSDVQQVEAASKTHLEDDEGGGGAAVIRMFEFGMNPQAFGDHQPTRQELFNSHYKGIELALWRDGLTVIPEVNPRIVIDNDKQTYKIFVGAQPSRGHLLYEQPRTLAQQIHGGTE